MIAILKHPNEFAVAPCKQEDEMEADKDQRTLKLHPAQCSLFDTDLAEVPLARTDAELFGDLLEPLEGWISWLFAYWVDGSEHDWVRAAWEALGRRGLIKQPYDDSGSEVLDNAALLVTLAAINNRFQGVRNGEGGSADFLLELPDIERTDLDVSDLHIGRWAERMGLPGEDNPDETLTDVLKEAAMSLAEEVYDALEAEWGQDRLFCSLWLTSRPDAVHPPSSEMLSEVMNHPTGDLMATYAWFTHDRDV